MEASSPSCWAASGLTAEFAASIVDVEAAGETSGQAQMSSVGGARVPGDAGHTAVLAASGRVGHSTSTGPWAERRTTDDPEHRAAASESMLASWTVAFDNLRWEDTAGGSWPLGWPCYRWRWALSDLSELSNGNHTYACRQGRNRKTRTKKKKKKTEQRLHRKIDTREKAYLMKRRSRWHCLCCKD